MKFFIKTLGCKVNQVESAYIVEKLQEKGYKLAEKEEEAEIFILNSCVVTAKAEAEGRKIIKRWSKLNPKLIVVAGCYPQAYKDALFSWVQKQQIKNLVLLGQKEKLKIEVFLEMLLKTSHFSEPKVFIQDLFQEKGTEVLFIKRFFSHSRAFVKVQDGCDQFCSYCIVPYARGAPRSVSLEEVLAEIERLIQAGYEEIVLTGIHLGQWGKDLTPVKSLTDLLWEIEKLFAKQKKDLILRLSSLEVREITSSFLEFAKNSAFLAPHFHIPLQSGSDRILRLMNRHYTSKEYLTILEKLYNLYPQATFGADVIVGFPSETEKDFLKTLEVIENSPLNWLHLFPFSPRPGTQAEKLTPKVKPEVIKARIEILKNIGKKKREDFLNQEVGKVRRAVVETINESEIKGLSENYISHKIVLPPPFPLSKGKILKVRFMAKEGDYLLGKVL
ncbi:tRNA (N(6)-L-threonylcarbamoyladenosine(37)-C(2))-methylthiotransferase MtaB [Thermodesulfobacterium sp. TA1]|uniref:tRNA (N(6)-L-threonylcarbamoyladenosine(37)-C(2))- methylthiotransferase MtaB n=1 Tax=Thermodesulfobacterium sp. TA1 TaxID=2234087 RepID=UPI001232E253|nr:tRNA (N(6)-L-threonylcarbamoyladenosine(37)-C(2))-methylthiotransferase MtaB [Thermodesulfobacterium sp. TA1]QER42875.1 tRNA (N(6)-L-threonylcarbamoyladenosine(37)-C(2))-methylthiotransferase MtaB [Thermodesulfobacterium sp. TA1]